MYLTAAAERLAAATLQVHLAAIVTAHRLVGLSLDPGHPSIALLLDGIRRRKGTRPSRQATPISPAMLARMVGAQPGTPLGLRNRAILLAGFGGALRRSEIVGLDAGDLEFVDGRGVVLTVRPRRPTSTAPARRSRSGAPTTRICALPPPCAAGWTAGRPGTPTTPCSSACAPAAS